MKYLRKIYHYLMALVSYFYYGCPSKKMVVIGVTGTKGKSTTCSLISSVLRAGGKKVGVLSTVEFRIGDKRELNTKKMTMLGRGQIHKYMRAMVKAGCEYAIIETSSEGIMQYRHKFLNYDIAVFTNLGTEHQERHGGFENLKKDKAKLFQELSKNKKIINGQEIKKVIIVNGDDRHYEYFFNFDAQIKYIYSLANIKFPVSNFQLLNAKIKSDDSFLVADQEYKINLIGKFNVYNSLASICVGRSQNISEDKIKQGIADVKLVEGRMEFVDEGQNFKVIVDYAHEALSYQGLFESLRQQLKNVHTSAKLIAVIGSDGGGRDVGKRGKMGSIAGELCDIVIITDVNCYDENPQEIVEMLAEGAREKGKIDGQDLFIEVDRKKAIELAIKKAQAGDIITILGKGTEPFIGVANGQKIPWDDRAVAREILKKYVNSK